MKEKKLVLSVILGVSLVALITALVTGLADSLSVLIDSGNIKDVYYHDDYNYLVGGLEIGAVALGIAFAAVFIFAKGKGKKVSTIVLAAVLAGYLIITTVVLKTVIPTRKGELEYGAKLYATDYALFTAYLTSVITVTVSTVLACVSSLLLGKAKKAEEAKQPAPEEGKSETSDNKD